MNRLLQTLYFQAGMTRYWVEGLRGIWTPSSRNLEETPAPTEIRELGCYTHYQQQVAQ